MSYFIDFYLDYHLNKFQSIFKEFLDTSKLDQRLETSSLDEKIISGEIEHFLRGRFDEIMPPLTLTGLKIDLKKAKSEFK